MLLDATITFLNFGLDEMVGVQRGFQSKEESYVSEFKETSKLRPTF
jgi:hypothetical protein